MNIWIKDFSNVEFKKTKLKMKPFLFFLFLIFYPSNSTLSQSNLLETVKKNPNEAIKICNKFKELNAKGISANSDKAIDFVSKNNNLTPVNAEIFSIYVIGLHCPEII